MTFIHVTLKYDIYSLNVSKLHRIQIKHNPELLIRRILNVCFKHVSIENNSSTGNEKSSLKSLDFRNETPTEQEAEAPSWTASEFQIRMQKKSPNKFPSTAGTFPPSRQ